MTPKEFVSLAVRMSAPAAIVSAADKYGVSKSDLIAFSGYPEAVVEGYFDSHDLDLDEYLGNPAREWGMEEVLAIAGVTQAAAREWLLAHRDQPELIGQAVMATGASAAVLAEIVGCSTGDVLAYFNAHGMGASFAYLA